MNLLKLAFLSAMVLATQSLFVSRASATTNCTATQPTLSFGTVSSTGATDVQGSFSVTCSTFGLSLLARARVTMCLSIRDGLSGGGNFNPRRMLNTSGDALQFQIYQDASRSLVWGARGNATVPNPVIASFDYSVPLLGGNQTLPFTLYGRIPAQVSAAGNFNNDFSGIHTAIEFRYDEALLGTPPFPATCTTGGSAGVSTTFPFTATANVPNHCQFNTVTNLAFSNVVGSISANQDQTSTIGLTCTLRTPWQLGLNNGQNASGNIRRMRLGATANYVNYELYRNAGRTLRWGNTLDTDTLTGTGSGLTQTIDVFGRVPPPQTVPAGDYKDVITVTMTF